MIKTKKIVSVSLNEYTSVYLERQIIRIINEYLPELKTTYYYRDLVEMIQVLKEKEKEKERIKLEIIANEVSALENDNTTAAAAGVPH